MTDSGKFATSLPSAIYVWLVPSEHVLEQPGSWRIRKWDTEPFPEANFTLSETAKRWRQIADQRAIEVADLQRQLAARSETASREAIIEECAKIGDSYSDAHETETAGDAIRALKNAAPGKGAEASKPDTAGDGAPANVAGNAPVAAPIVTESVPSRDDVIEECASYLEKAPLTYAGPDPTGVKQLRFLMCLALRGLKESANG